MSEIMCECCDTEGDNPSRIICDACFQSAKGKADCCIANQAENKQLKEALRDAIDEMETEGLEVDNYKQALKGK